MTVGLLASVVVGMVDVSLVPLVVLGVVAVAVLMSIVFLISGENAYDQIGQGGMTRDSEAPPESTLAPAAPPAPLSSAAGRSSIGRAEQEREVRQMLGARSARMVARGEPAIDIDAEVAKLLAPAEGAEGAGGGDGDGGRRWARRGARSGGAGTRRGEERTPRAPRAGATGCGRGGAAYPRRAGSLRNSDCIEMVRSDINAEWPARADTSSTS